MKPLPPHLLPILQFKMQGYTHQAIADKLKYPIETINKYSKRLIGIFKAEGWWDPCVSVERGFVDCGHQYFETFSSSTAFNKVAMANTSFMRTIGLSVYDDAEYSRMLANLPTEQIKEILRKISHDSHETADWAMRLGNHFYREWLCTEAIQVFHIAENLAGAVVYQTAKAACSTAQMFLELGDLYAAKAKIVQAQQLYESVAEIGTRIRIQHINGWVDYYEGNLDQAEGWYLDSLAIASSKDMAHFSQDAHHFLGRIYCSHGQLSKRKQEATEWFRKAEDHLNNAYQLHLIYGDDGDKGYDLLRIAQLRQAQRRWREARQLREHARHLFGTGRYYLDIELEEAEIFLKNHDEREALWKAESALEGWAEVKKAKSMADALRTMGHVRCLQGKTQHTLELYIASLCLNPYENFPSNRRLWPTISIMLQHDHTPSGQKQVQHIIDLLEERRGAFAYLNNITVDRSADIAHVVHKLKTLVR